jgi:hypothetical protein
MRDFTIRTIGAAITAATLGIAVAGGPPEFDVHLSCSAADRALPRAGTDKSRADIRACLDDERTARDALVKAWAGFAADARARCVGMNRTGGPPSYVELLTCLEVVRDARKRP